jgi:integrase
MPQQTAHPVLGDFLDDMAYAESTTRSVTSHLCIFERWATAHGLDILKATHVELAAFQADRAATVGASTLFKSWQVLDSFYGWAQRPHPTTRKDRPGGNLIDRNPMLKVPAPVVPDRLPNRRYASAADVDKMLTYFDRLATRRRAGTGEFLRAKRNAAVLALVADSGMRIGEVPWIDLHHLITDANGDYVAVTVGGDDGSHTKTAKGREVPVSARANRYLRRYVRHRGTDPGPLFIGREAHTNDPTGRMTTRALQEVVKRATKRVGVELSPHDLRREWTAEMHRAGASNDDIKLAGGWSKSETMLLYAGQAAGLAAAGRLRRLHSVAS